MLPVQANRFVPRERGEASRAENWLSDSISPQISRVWRRSFFWNWHARLMVTFRGPRGFSHTRAHAPRHKVQRKLCRMSPGSYERFSPVRFLFAKFRANSALSCALAFRLRVSVALIDRKKKQTYVFLFLLFFFTALSLWSIRKRVINPRRFVCEFLSRIKCNIFRKHTRWKNKEDKVVNYLKWNMQQ